VKCLSIYLNGGGVATLPHGWEKFANFKLILINQFDHKMNVTGGIFHTYLSTILFSKVNEDYLAPNDPFTTLSQ